MTEYKLGEVEMKFADIIWENEPITSRELARISEEKLNWKKSTTYTILRRICDRGLFQNENGTVTSNVSKEEFFAKQSEKFVEDTFDGSLPKFVAAFTSGKKLSRQDVEEIQRIIDQSK
ncbi:MAG: BlaI/MecI/CopY family transcriptional regulator [Lachnospiraceae bacterium]|nr:BlaI/MecI/CopY family transcriptional regulator [Lachnospiraceae bacterium]